VKGRWARLLFDKDLVANDYRAVISFIGYLLVFCFVCKYAVETAGGGHIWKAGDWLINYEGGWIRRGLMGQALYRVPGSGFNMLWILFCLQTAIYVSIAHLVLKLFFSVRREVSWLLFIFSPAFIFLFPFYDMQAGFRKEIMVFLSFCLMAAGLMGGRLNHRYLIPSLLLYWVAVFSHEAAVLCVFFFVYLLFECTQPEPGLRGMGRVYMAGFSAAAVAGLLFVVSYQGTADASVMICKSLERRGLSPDICGGAIQWLGFDVRYAWNQVSFKKYILVYPLLFLLSAAPLFLTGWWKRKLPVLLVGLGFVLPLFVVAIDWGRWIHIYCFMIFTLLLFDSSRERTTIYRLPLIVVAAYGGLWCIPHLNAGHPCLGIFSLVYKILERL